MLPNLNASVQTNTRQLWVDTVRQVFAAIQAAIGQGYLTEGFFDANNMAAELSDPNTLAEALTGTDMTRWNALLKAAAWHRLKMVLGADLFYPNTDITILNPQTGQPIKVSEAIFRSE